MFWKVSFRITKWRNGSTKKSYVSPEERQQIIDELRHNNMIIKYQKIANLLDNGVALNASNQPSKFRAKNWVELNDE